MKLTLISCNAQRPDRRIIANCLIDISINIEASLAQELTEILLEGDPVSLEVENKNSGSALRALRKLQIDYNIVE